MRCVFVPLQGTNADYSLIVIPGGCPGVEHSGISLTHLGGRGLYAIRPFVEANPSMQYQGDLATTSDALGTDFRTSFEYRRRKEGGEAWHLTMKSAR